MAHDQVGGRWSGKLTSRPLPDDPEIAALPGVDRALLAASWLSRSAMERRVADAFVVIRDALQALSADPVLITLADRAIDDELRHAGICRVVASRFSGRDVGEPARLPLVVPSHVGAEDELRQVLHVVGHCAINETFASAVLQHSLGAAKGALARAALRELLSDEIDHARVGFGLVASLSKATKAALGVWLAGLVRASVMMWRTTPRPDTSEESLAAHGMMSPEMIERAVLTATREVIIPGFAHLAVETVDVVAWLESGAR